MAAQQLYGDIAGGVAELSHLSGKPLRPLQIWAAISSGRALPPVTPAIISARCRGAERLRASQLTCGRPV
jgi:hypothetical protein